MNTHSLTHSLYNHNQARSTPQHCLNDHLFNRILLLTFLSHGPDIVGGDLKTYRLIDLNQPFFFFLITVSQFGHKCGVSTRGKCSSSPISLLECAHRFLPLLTILLLSASPPLRRCCPDFFFISPSRFDLPWGDTTLPSSPRAEQTIFSRSLLCRAHSAHLPQGHLFKAKLMLHIFT